MNGIEVLALCVAIVVGLGAATARMARRAASWTPAGEFVEVERLRLHYVRRGAGPPVVFLHGSDGFAQDFTETIFPRLESQACCIAIDRPGHGWSDIPRGNGMRLVSQARLIRESLRKLDVRSPVLVGHSWGAALAASLAVEFPGEFAGLVLVSGYLYPGRKVTAPALRVPLWLFLLVPRLPLLGPLIVSTLTPLIRPLVLRIGLRLAFWPHPVPSWYARQASALWIRTVSRIRALAVENATDEPLMDSLSRRYASLAVPVFAIAGVDDQILSVEVHTRRFAREHPGAKVTLLRDAGHQLTISHPDDVAAAVRQCLDAVRPGIPSAQPCARSDYDRARDLVYRFGWNSTAYQILNPSMRHWFSADGEAAVGYVTEYGVRIAAGAPVCDESRLLQSTRDFEADAARVGETVCWFGAADRLREALRGENQALITVGAQPVWRVARWPGIVAKNGSLRAQLNRARNKGVIVEEWAREQAAGSEQLQAILRSWMAARAMPRLGFLTEPIAPDRLADRRIFVAVLGTDPLAFLVCAPIPSRSGWMVEQISRSPRAPNGTAELLVARVMDTLREEGADIVTLGLAPLSTRADSATGRAAPLSRLLLAWIGAHGRRFYNFEGLDAFKAKFKPDYWEPIYAISNEPRVSVKTLYAIAAAFTEGPPIRFLGKAVVAAVRQEWEWLKHRLLPRSSR